MPPASSSRRAALQPAATARHREPGGPHAGDLMNVHRRRRRQCDVDLPFRRRTIADGDDEHQRSPMAPRSCFTPIRTTTRPIRRAIRPTASPAAWSSCTALIMAEGGLGSPGRSAFASASTSTGIRRPATDETLALIAHAALTLTPDQAELGARDVPLSISQPVRSATPRDLRGRPACMTRRIAADVPGRSPA